MKKQYLTKFKAFFDRPPLHNIVMVVAFVLFLLLIRQWTVLEQVSRSNARLIQEFGQVKEGVIQYGTDLNEMREYLLLPTRQYDFFPETGDGEKGDDLALGLYRFTHEIGKNHLLKSKQKAHHEAIKNLIRNQAFLEGLRTLNLLPVRRLEETDEFIKFKFYQGKNIEVLALVLDREGADFYMESILGSELLELKEGETIDKVALAYLQDHLETILRIKNRIAEQRETIKQILQSENVSSILSTKKLQVSLDPSEVKRGFEYIVYNAATEPLLSFWIDRKTGSLQLSESAYSDAKDLKADLIEQLNQLDAETDYEKMVKSQKEKLSQVIEEPAFAEALKLSHLRLEPARDVESRIYYDLKNIDDDKMLGSIIFDTLTGSIKFFSATSNIEYKLEDVLTFGVKKNG